MTETATIQLDHVYSQPPAVVWNALTDPALHAKWWAAGDVRAEVGHRFTLDMGQWGKTPCEVLKVEPERLFQYRFGPGTLDTILTWRLVAEGRGTRLTLTHEGFKVDSPMGKQAFEGMKSGWPTVLGRLATTLAA